MTTPAKPAAKTYAKAAAAVLGPRLMGAGLTFSIYLFFAWVLTVALRHSVGVGLPWFPLAVLIQYGSVLLRMIAELVSSGIAKGAATGKHEAELEQMKATVRAALASPDLLTGLLGKGSSGDKQAPLAGFGQYL